MNDAPTAMHAATSGPSRSRLTSAPSTLRLVTVLLTAVVLLSGRAESQQRPDLTPPTLIVETSAGAQVFVDGTLMGLADPKGRLVLQNPAAGRRALKVSLEGRKTFEQTISIVAGRTTRVLATLAEILGTLDVRTTPGADVQVDGRSVGRADARGELSIPNLRPGRVRVRASHPGHASQEREISIPAEETVVVSMPLTPVATATVSSDAPSAVGFKPNRTFAGHDAAIRRIVFSADARRLASDDADFTLRVYEVPSGAEVQSCSIGHSHERSIRDIAFDTDGHLLAAFADGDSRSDDREEIRIRDCEGADTVPRGFRPAERGNPYSLSLSADGRRIAIGGEEQGSVSDLRSGTQLSALAPAVCANYVNSCSLKVNFGSTGSVAVAANGSVLIMDASDGRVIRQFARPKDPSKPRESPDYKHPQLSADGRWLAVLRKDSSCAAVACFPATFPPDHIQLWHVSSGREGFTLGPFPTRERQADRTENAAYTEFAFSPNGREVAALTVSLEFGGGRHPLKSVLRFYDLGTGNELIRHEIKEGVGSIAFSPDGHWFALGMDDGTIRLWRR